MKLNIPTGCIILLISASMTSLRSLQFKQNITQRDFLYAIENIGPLEFQHIPKVMKTLDNYRLVCKKEPELIMHVRDISQLTLDEWKFIISNSKFKFVSILKRVPDDMKKELYEIALDQYTKILFSNFKKYDEFCQDMFGIMKIIRDLLAINKVNIESIYNIFKDIEINIDILRNFIVNNKMMILILPYQYIEKCIDLISDVPLYCVLYEYPELYEKTTKDFSCSLVVAVKECSIKSIDPCNVDLIFLSYMLNYIEYDRNILSRPYTKPKSSFC